VVYGAVSSAVILVTVVGRLLSGVHWLTDIIGGVILSAALVMLYVSVLKYVESRSKT
jgi:undecaprenyl-diphosphatase